jgi:hypothetical protein
MDQTTHMRTPLSKSQEMLRGRKRVDMTDAQLRDWIDACDKMETWVKSAKARRSWVNARADAEAEMARRNEKAGRAGPRAI